MSDLIRITVALESEVVDQLDKIAADDHRSRTSLLRKVLADLVAPSPSPDDHGDELTA